MTLAAVADNKGIRLERLDVRIGYRIETGSQWQTAFRIGIDLGSGLTPREQSILFNSARFCEVTKLLAGTKTFDYEMISEG